MTFIEPCCLHRLRCAVSVHLNKTKNKEIQEKKQTKKEEEYYEAMNYLLSLLEGLGFRV